MQAENLKPQGDACNLLNPFPENAGGTAPLIMVDGIVRDSYNDIDPNEVDNISILKDASATAVFGVRGANGVILINTKRGKEGATKVSATVQTAATQFTRLPKYVNAWQYATLRNEQRWETLWQTLANDPEVLDQPDGWAKFEEKRKAQYQPYKTDEDLKYYQNAHKPTLEDGSRNPYYDPYFHPDNNWQHQIYKNYGPQTQANVNMTGGTKSMKYFLSAGYLTQGGLFNTDYMPFSKEMDYRKNRYNVRGNFDFDVNDDFKINVNVGTQFVQVTGMDNDGYNYQKNLMWTNPMASPGYIDGKFVFIERQEEEQNNPLYSLVLRNKYNINDQSTLNSSIGLTHKLDFITKGLSINVKGSYDSYFASVSEGQSYPVVWTVRPNPNGDNLDPIWVQKGNETPSSMGKVTDTAFYPLPGTYKINMYAVDKRGNLYKAATPVTVTTTRRDPAYENLVRGGNVNPGDEQYWKVFNQSTTVKVTWAIKNNAYNASVATPVSSPTPNGGIWQPVQVVANKKYRFSMKASYGVTNVAWLEVYLGAVEPASVGDYTDGGKKLGYITWGSWVPYNGTKTVEIVPGLTGTMYLAIKAGCNGGGSFGPTGFDVSNIDFRRIQE